VSGEGTFTIRSANPLDPNLNTGAQYSRSEFEKLSIRLPAVSNTTLAVWMVPLASGESTPTGSPTITPLETWTIQK
jgi:hypothetical protein